MPFFFSGMWIFPMFFMPLMAFLMIFFLYKKGFFDTIINSFNEGQKKPNYSENDLIQAKDNENEPLKIVNLRYARGEISKAEYQELKAELKNWYNLGPNY